MFGGLFKLFSGRQQRLADMAAITQQAKADEAVRKAQTPPADSEDARKASDKYLKRVQGRRGVRSTYGAGGRGDVAAPSLGVKVLTGQ